MDLDNLEKFILYVALLASFAAGLFDHFESPHENKVTQHLSIALVVAFLVLVDAFISDVPPHQIVLLDQEAPIHSKAIVAMLYGYYSGFATAFLCTSIAKLRGS